VDAASSRGDSYCMPDRAHDTRHERGCWQQAGVPAASAALSWDIPDEVIAGLDAHAGRLGLSRSEYVRRRLAQDAAQPGSTVSVQDLTRFAETFADLADDNVMSQAWR